MLPAHPTLEGDRPRSTDARRLRALRTGLILADLVRTNLDTAVAYIFRLRADGTAYFSYVSQSCERLYGFTAEEAEADVRLMHDAIHPEDRNSFGRAGQHSAEQLEEVMWEGRILRIDGRERPVTIASVPKRLLDGTVEWRGVVRDRRPVVVGGVAPAEEVEGLNPQDWLGMLGHDIGTPLAVISGYAAWGLEVLEDDAHDRSNEKVDLVLRRCFQVITRQAQRLDRLRNDLLAMAAVEAHAVHADPDLVLVLPHLQAAAELRTRDVSVEIDCASDLMCWVQPGHLDQMLANLVSNAERFATGRVRLRATTYDGDRVRIMVEDDGPGVPTEALSRLFARFAHEGLTRPAKSGAGLGLYIVRALAQANGGTVLYEPEREWTRFTLSLRRPAATTPRT